MIKRLTDDTEATRFKRSIWFLTEFFDSFGNSPDRFSFNDFVERNSNTVTFNSLKLQGNLSMTCGGFCVYFALNRCRGVKMFEIVTRFSKNEKVNDRKIGEFMYYKYSIQVQWCNKDYLFIFLRFNLNKKSFISFVGFSICFEIFYVFQIFDKYDERCLRTTLFFYTYQYYCHTNLLRT